MKLRPIHFVLLCFCLCSARHLGQTSPNPANKLLAPFHECPPRDEIGRYYAAALHWDRSFESHFEYIGQDLRLTEDYLELAPWYAAKMETDDLINIVRSDPGVRMVAEDCKTWDPYTEMSPGLAPLTRCEMFKPSRENIYLVYFEWHHTLDLHFQQIGMDFRSGPRFVYINLTPDYAAYQGEDPLRRDEYWPVPAYAVYLETYDLVDLIRRDYGVREVEVDCELLFLHDMFCRCEECLAETECPMYLMSGSPNTKPHKHCAHPYTGDELPDDVGLEVYDEVATLPISFSTTLAPLDPICAPGDSMNRLYHVWFHKRHTFVEHFQFLGQDLRSTPRFEEIDFLPKVKAYQAYVATDDLLNLIRSDPGVELVEEFCKIHFVEDVECLPEWPCWDDRPPSLG